MTRTTQELQQRFLAGRLPFEAQYLITKLRGASMRLETLKGGEQLNNFSAVGRAGADPEVRQTQSGKTVANVQFAVSRISKGQDGKYGTDWFRVEAWGQTAEILGKYVKKGHRFAVHGRVEIEQWTSSKTGQPGTTVKIVANGITLLEPAPKDGEGSNQTATADDAEAMFA